MAFSSLKTRSLALTLGLAVAIPAAHAHAADGTTTALAPVAVRAARAARGPDSPTSQPFLGGRDEFDVSTGEETVPFLVDVLPVPTTVAAGDVAPLITTPTRSETPIEDLTTDGNPMSSLYEMSLDEAFTNGRQSVVIFATPAYCTSAACGPLLQQTKDAAAMFDDVNFIHVEVYSGFNEAGFQPDVAHLVPAVEAFKLPSEPWIFVVDQDGVDGGLMLSTSGYSGFTPPCPPRPIMNEMRPIGGAMTPPWRLLRA